MEKTYKYEAYNENHDIWEEITESAFYNSSIGVLRKTEIDEPNPSQIVGNPGILDVCYKIMQERVNNGWNAESVFAAFKLSFRKELIELGLDANYDVSKFEIE
jgi:hypothetical protein